MLRHAEQAELVDDHRGEELAGDEEGDGRGRAQPWGRDQRREHDEGADDAAGPDPGLQPGDTMQVRRRAGAAATARIIVSELTATEKRAP